MTRPAIVAIGSPPGVPDEAALRFPDWPAFAASGAEADGFYLGHDEGLAAAVRRSRWWDRPVIGAPGLPQHPALDGTGSWAEAAAAIEKAAAVRASLALDPAGLHFDERLLYYLYQREPGDLVPRLDRNAARLYGYPVADLLADPGTDVGAWLTSLVQRGLLEPTQLVDRTRHCRRCQSAHLHFVDVCPHCASLHIHRGASLHCFSCGHVAPEPDFMGDRGLVCPKCATRLRHIGVDYDRPLTQYSCAACHHAFIEASVLARCLDCAQALRPEELPVHEVAVLRLSMRGRAALRAGQIRDTFAALEGIGFSPLEQFKTLVDWALATQQRHPELQFGLVLVELSNAVQLVEAHGAQRAYLMLDEFARRLRELLRSSDVSTRTSEEKVWLFLPYASVEGFVARVRTLLDDVSARGGPRIALRTASLLAPRDIKPGERVDALMARLQEQR